MKTKVIEALTTKFSGVDAKILGRIADNIMHSKTIETEDDVNSAVEEVTFADVLKSYGDSRAAEATKSSVLNYEKKHGLKDGKPLVARKEDENEDEENNKSDKSAKKSKEDPDEIPAWAKALIDSNKELKDELSAMKQGKITDSRKAKFNKAIEGLTELQRKAYSRVSLENLSDEDFDSLMKEVSSEVEEFAKENSGKGAALTPPIGGKHTGSDVKEASDKEVEDVLSHMNI